MNTLTKSIVVVIALLVACSAGCQDMVTTDQAPTYQWEVSGRHLLAISVSGCGQCKRDEPKLSELETQGVDVIHATYEKNPDIDAKYNPTGKYPHYVALEDGKIVGESSSLSKIIKVLKFLVWITSLGLL